MIGVAVGMVSRCMDFPSVCPSVTRYNSHVCIAILHSYPTRNIRAYISDDVNNAVRGLEIIKLVDLS